MSNTPDNNLEKEFLYYASLAEKPGNMEAYKLIAAGKQALDTLKLLNGYSDEIKDAQKYGEFMRIIGQLNLEVAEIQTRLAEQIQNNLEKDEKIKQLEAKIEELEKPTFIPELRNGKYVNKLDIETLPLGTQRFEYYCTACYDNEKKIIRLIETHPSKHTMVGQHECPVCKTGYPHRQQNY